MGSEMCIRDSRRAGLRRVCGEGLVYGVLFVDLAYEAGREPTTAPGFIQISIGESASLKANGFSPETGQSVQIFLPNAPTSAFFRKKRKKFKKVSSYASGFLRTLHLSRGLAGRALHHYSIGFRRMVPKRGFVRFWFFWLHKCQWGIRLHKFSVCSAHP